MIRFQYTSTIHLFYIILLVLNLFLTPPAQDHNIIYGGEISADLKKPSSEFNIHIIFTGEENGYLEPCGCSEKEIGGLSKRHTLIKQLKDSGQNYALLSLGDLSKEIGRQSEIKMETILNALDRMGYIAHNIGEKDINMGLELLGYLSQISNVNFISSNINLQELNIKPYVIQEIKTEETVLRVGILGILSPNLLGDGYQYIETKDPVESLKPLLAELKEKTDILVLLSHAEIDYSQELAETFPEFDLVISGHGIDEPDLYIKKVGNTYVIPVGEKGKYLGKITFPLEYSLKEQAFQMVNQSQHRKVLTQEKLKHYGLLDYYSKNINTNINTKGPYIEIVSLDERYGDSPEIKDLLKIYQQRLKDEELVKNVFKSDPPSGLAFIGNDDCAICHNKIFKHWGETHHASAYETLVKAEHENDPECLSCHTIGMHYTTGFETIETTPKMKGVGCESCHGPGSDHKLTLSKDYGKAGEEVCMACHEAEHSPKFQFKEYWQKITHPPDDMKSGSYN